MCPDTGRSTGTGLGLGLVLVLVLGVGSGFWVSGSRSGNRNVNKYVTPDSSFFQPFKWAVVG